MSDHNLALSTRLQQCFDMERTESRAAIYVNATIVFLIIVSVFCSMMNTVEGQSEDYYLFYQYLEYVFVTIFIAEYLLRIYAAPKS